MASTSTSASAVSLQPLSALVGQHKDYRIHRSMPLSEPLRGLPPMARPVDASYYPRKPRAVAVPTPPSSASSVSSAASSSSDSVYYRQRSESFEAMLLGPSSRASLSAAGRSGSSRALLAPEPETPFDAHLAAVYSGECDPADGLAFFESHGYYDVDDANTVAMFRSNFGLTDVFWDKSASPEAPDGDEHVLVLVEAPGGAMPSVGATLYRRHRTVSGRFELVDADSEADAREQERARAARLRAKALELDDFDLRELAREQAGLARAISAIRSETREFQQFFAQAFGDADARLAFAAPPAAAPVPFAAPAVPAPLPSVASNNVVAVPPALAAGGAQLPPYCGNVFVLKDTIPYLLRSWHKRWCYLDFASGLLLLYKRSYWKSPRGVLDLRDVARVERMTASDFRIEFKSAAQPTLLLRTKLGEDAALWVNLLRFAKAQAGASPSPAAGLEAPRARPRLLGGGKSTGARKPKAAGPKNQVEMLAMVLSNTATPAPASASSQAPTVASASAASASSARSGPSRRNSVSTA